MKADAQPVVAFGYSVSDGLRHAYGPTRTPGTLILVSLFSSASVSLLCVNMLVQVLTALRTGTSASIWPIDAAIKILVVLFAFTIGVAQSWRRHQEWEVASLVGSGLGYAAMSSVAESLARCAFAIATSFVGVGIAALAFRFFISSAMSVNLSIAWGSIVAILVSMTGAVLLSTFITSAIVAFRQGFPRGSEPETKGLVRSRTDGR
jgi:hypothetical protein